LDSSQSGQQRPVIVFLRFNYLLDPGTHSRLHTKAGEKPMSREGRGQPFRSGELARFAEVSTDTLRHYERVGVLARAPRTASGYRQYPRAALERVRVIRQALAVGFSLEELARVFRIRDTGGAPCREVRELAKVKLKQMEKQLADLKAVRNRLRMLLGDWDKRLRATPTGARAGLLDSLAAPPRRSGPKKGERK
jgi:MerR family copper efflux transcriptional regulator